MCFEILNLDLVSPRTATAPVSREGTLFARFMAGVACVALPIAGLIPMEVVEPFFPAPWQRPSVTVMRIKAVVDVAVEAVPAVEPGAGSKKHPTDKPVGTIVAVRSAVIGLIVEVPIGAHWGHSNADGNLGWA